MHGGGVCGVHNKGYIFRGSADRRNQARGPARLRRLARLSCDGSVFVVWFDESVCMADCRPYGGKRSEAGARVYAWCTIAGVGTWGETGYTFKSIPPLLDVGAHICMV